MSFSFLTAAAEAAERIALVLGGVSYTYGALGGRVDAAGAELEAQLEDERREEPRIAVVGARRLPVLVAIWALVERGIPFALIHPRASSAERDRRLADLGHPLLIGEDWDDPAASGVGARRVASSPSPQSSVVPDDERCCVVVFTSGTSGVPRGARLSRRAFAAAADASAANLGWLDGDRWLLAMPLSHVGGLSIVLRCLRARRTVVLAEEEAFDARAMAETMERDGVTLASLVPTMLWRLLELEPRWRPSAPLRAVLLGGAPASSTLLERAAARGVPVLTTYGLTEACSQVTTQPLGTVNRGDLGAGRAIEGVELRLAPQPGDEPGEGTIEVRGATLFDGYLGDGPSDPFTADGWLRTGDVGRIDAAGYLQVLGRRGDLVISGGENVHPLEVEKVLERHPAVARACVFGIDDEEWGEIVAVALVASAVGPVADDELGRFLAERLAAHQRPRRLCWLESLAESASGKIDRRRVRRECAVRLRPLAREQR